MFIKNFLLSIDIFGHSPALLIDKKSHFSTLAGTICTLLTSLLFLFLLFSSDFFQKTNPKVFSQSFTAHQTPILKLSKNIFPLFLALSESYWDTYDENLGIFHFKMEQLILKKDYKDGRPHFNLIEKTEIKLKKCQTEDVLPFNILPKEEIDATITKMHYYCPEDKEFFLQGSIDEDKILQVIITLNPCSNKTSEIICQSQEDIQKFFESPKQVSLGYVDYDEDVEKFKNPIVNNLKFETFIIKNSERRQNMISLKQSFFKTSSGISDETTIVTIKLDEFKNEFMYIYTTPDALFYLTLLSSKKYDKLTRSYQTIGEALASSFSLIKVTMIIIRMFLWYFKKNKFKLHLLNKMYDFDVREEKNKSQSKFIKKEEEKLKENSDKKMFPKKKFFKFSIWQAVKAEFKHMFYKKRTSNNEKLYLLTQNIIQRDTDLANILHKLHEIEKIKLLLFNENQLFLFNNLPDPFIYVESIEGDKNFGKKLSDSLRESELENISKTDISDIELKIITQKLVDSNDQMDRRFLFFLNHRLKFLREGKFEKCKDLEYWRRYTLS